MLEKFSSALYLLMVDAIVTFHSIQKEACNLIGRHAMTLLVRFPKH